MDSQAALLSLQSDKFVSKLVYQCFGQLSKLPRENEVTLVWVPGHQGILGNEKVDGLAREGSSDPATGPAPHLPLSKSWSAETIREHLRKKNRERWQKLTSCRQTKCFIKEPLPSRTIALVRGLERGQLRLLCGVLSGHYTFRKHLHTMKLSDTFLCPRCGADEDTAFHLVCNCPTLAMRRKSILGDYVLSEVEAGGLKVEDILNFVEDIEI